MIMLKDEHVDAIEEVLKNNHIDNEFVTATYQITVTAEKLHTVLFYIQQARRGYTK